MFFSVRQCSFVVALAVSPLLLAQNEPLPPSAVWTIEDLVNTTVGQSLEIRFYEAQISMAQADRRSAALLSNPVVSGSVGPMRTKNLDGSLAGEGVAWSVSVMQTFDWPGRLGLRKAIANRDISLSELGLERFKASLGARVRSLAYGLFGAQEKAIAAAEVANRLRDLKDVLVQRDPAGVTPLLETRVIEAYELTAQRQAADLALALESGILELNALRGFTNTSRFTILPAQLEFRPIVDRTRLTVLARTNNFDLRLRAVELEQQGFRVDLAKNERWPSVSIGPSMWQQNAADDQRSVGVGISFPLPLWNRNASGVQSAKARQIQAETLLAVAQRNTEREVAQAAATYDAKLQEMNRWRPEAVEHFREAAELADRHYRLGAVPAATYVELQRQYLDAVNGLLDTKREALEAGQQLELLTGLTEPLVTVRPEGAQ